MKAKRVIISGGTGLVGSAITDRLLSSQTEVVILTTQKNRESTKEGLIYSHWNPQEQIIDHKVFEQPHVIMNLAGASLNKRWSKSYKEEILSSRVNSTRLLVQVAMNEKSRTTHFVSTSAVGIYPSTSNLHVESDHPDSGFLAQVCRQWEAETEALEATKVKKSILRVGVVMSTNGGALDKLLPIFNLGIGSPVGSGNQYMSPIHVSDLAAMFCWSFEQNLEGTFNAVSPDTVTNKRFSQILASELNKPFFLPRVPSFVLKTVLGEMSMIVLDGQRASSSKIASTGFQWQFPTLQEQLHNLLN